MMSKKDFERILERYLNGAATEQEIRWIEKWYSTLDSENNYPVLNAEEEQLLDRSDLEQIQQRIRAKKNKALTRWPSLTAAAAVIIVGAIALYNTSIRTTAPADEVTKETSIALTDEEIANRSADIKVVRLSDSSLVSLHPNSVIRIAGDFNRGDRKISLQGEAFFNVAPDKDRPFRVFTHDVVTTVLGTSFTIKAPSNKEKITVVVCTGRVAVSSKAGKRGNKKSREQEVIVTPNQQAVFNPDNHVLETTLVQNPVVLHKPEKKREVFDAEPIIHILQHIEELYGVDIQYDETALAHCRITTAFLKEGLYERLDLLSKAIGATYTVEGTRIIFKSNGCEI